jgi:sec-independent protein translocase protein TatA
MFPFNLGWVELTIILVIVVVIFGAGKLPEIGSSLGKSIRGFKDEVTDASKDGDAKAEAKPADLQAEAKPADPAPAAAQTSAPGTPAAPVAPAKDEAVR